MIPIEIPRPIQNFDKSNLSGWQKNRIVVSNNADPRIMDFDFESTVYRNWPSQQHRKYPRGFIQFNNSRKFDIYRQTIFGVPKWLFFYRDVTIYLELYVKTKKLREALNGLKDEDFFAAAELIIRPIDPTFVVSMSRSRAEGELARHLPAVGLQGLRELVALLTVPIPARPTLNVAA